jgi:hypothetical protein
MGIRRVIDNQDLSFTTERMHKSLQCTYSATILKIVEENQGDVMTKRLEEVKETYHHNLSTINDFVSLYKELEGVAKSKEVTK